MLGSAMLAMVCLAGGFAFPARAEPPADETSQVKSGQPMESNTMQHTPSESLQKGIRGLKPQVMYTGYFVSDIERSLRFYRDVLGMEKELQFDLGGGVYEMVLTFPGGDGRGLILLWDTHRTKPYERGDGYSRVVITVSDMDATLQHLRAHGVPFVKELVEREAYSYCYVADPDGYAVEFLHLKQAGK